MIQRRAARFVKQDYRRTSSVTDMLTDLGWDSLQGRRNQARLSMFYKIMHGLVEVVPDPPLRNSRSSRTHNQQITQISTSKASYQHSFYPATITLWNKLPQATISQPTLAGFQAALAGLNAI